MSIPHRQFRAKRVYEVTPRDGHRELRLSDRLVELGEQEFGWYEKVRNWLPSVKGVSELSQDLGMSEAKVPKFLEALEKTGLLYKADVPEKTMTGLEFHKAFK